MDILAQLTGDSNFRSMRYSLMLPNKIDQTCKRASLLLVTVNKSRHGHCCKADKQQELTEDRKMEAIKSCRALVIFFFFYKL